MAAAYERTRPEYPAAAVERAAAELGLDTDATVLDLGAGTGKLTRRLRERFARVVAVEPDGAMRAHIGGDARAGSAESIPAADRSVDAVFAGDAFHWFDPAPALAEIVRVLRPGGGVALIWNTWGGDREMLPAAFRADLDEIWARFHAPDRAFPDWHDGFVGTPFGPLGDAELPQKLRVSGRDLVDLWLTGSTPASIPDEERNAVAERAYPLMAPEYTLRFSTLLHWTRLR